MAMIEEGYHKNNGKQNKTENLGKLKLFSFLVSGLSSILITGARIGANADRRRLLIGSHFLIFSFLFGVRLFDFYYK